MGTSMTYPLEVMSYHPNQQWDCWVNCIRPYLGPQII